MATDTTHLRNALATRDNGDGQAPEKSLAVVVRDAIDRQAAAFRAVLPAGVDHDRFARLTMVAIKANPKLMAAFTTKSGQTSILLAVMQAAALGLEPNTPTQECWLLPRNRKIKGQRGQPDEWVAEAELSIGYKGYSKLVRNTAVSNGAPVKTIFAQVVREADHFVWSRGIDADVLEHTVAAEDPGADDEATLTHVYAVVRFKDGSSDFVVMNRRQVEKRRAMSDSWKRDQKYSDQAPRSPWNVWPEEQWKKTGIRTLCKGLDLSPQLERAMQSDEARLALSDGQVTALPYEELAGELEEAPNGVDPATGEIGPGDFPAENIPGDIPADEPEHIEASAVEHPIIRGETEQVGGKMSRPQQAKIFASLKEQGIEDRLDRLDWASGNLGREIGSFNDLTRADAKVLIDRLEKLAQADGKSAEAES